MTAAGAILSTVLALASPQSQPAPQRPPRPGTGLIVGRVVDGLVPAAMTLTIAEGEKKVQDIRTGGR